MAELRPTVTVPGTDLTVPPLALGTMYWGTDTDTEQTHALLDAAVEAGATFLDTANNYAFWREGGTGDESETVVGSWLAARGSARRSAVTLATKVGARPRHPGGGLDEAWGLRPEAVATQVRESLGRLRTDHLDLVYAHVDDPEVPLAEAVGGMAQLVTDGLTRAVAVSNLTAPRLREAGGSGAYAALQNRFTYLVPAADADLGPHVLLDDEVADVAADLGVALVGYSPLLSGAYTRDDRPLPAAYDHTGTEPALATLRRVAYDAGLDAGQAVLAWMGQRTQPVVPVAGVSTLEQLRSAVRAASTPLPAHDLAALDRARAA